MIGGHHSIFLISEAKNTLPALWQGKIWQMSKDYVRLRWLFLSTNVNGAYWGVGTSPGRQWYL